MDRQPKDTRIRWNKGSSSEIKLSNKFGSADLPQNLPAIDGLFVKVIELTAFFVVIQPSRHLSDSIFTIIRWKTQATVTFCPF